jgi:hypothetical protein
MAPLFPILKAEKYQKIEYSRTCFYFFKALFSRWRCVNGLFPRTPPWFSWYMSMSWIIFWSCGWGHTLQGGVSDLDPSHWIFSPLLATHTDTLPSACLQSKNITCTILHFLGKFRRFWSAGSLDFLVSWFFPESDTPIGEAELASPRTVPMYFKGLIYIFWMSSAGFRWRGLELCSWELFFSVSAAPVCRTSPAAPHTTHNFFVCFFYIYLWRLAELGGRVRELFFQLYFFSDSEPPACWTAPAAPSTNPHFFAGLIVIFWLSLAEFASRGHEFDDDVFFDVWFSTGPLWASSREPGQTALNVHRYVIIIPYFFRPWECCDFVIFF